jgi:hypothetical protein
MFKSLAKEPLVHFLGIGAVLFLLFGLVGEPMENNERRIEITEQDINRLSTNWQRQWNRPPSQAELSGLVEKTIREEILYREALQMGLDEEDSVIRRRLAQKLEFLIQDVASQAKPGTDELQAFLDNNQDRFIDDARYSFSHIYFNPDKHGREMPAMVGEVLTQLMNNPAPADIGALGDLFMLDQEFSDNTSQQLDRLFGRSFSQQLESLKVGEWDGPVQSGYGVHLIMISNKIPSRLPELAEIEGKVARELMVQKQKEANEQVYMKMRSLYEVVVAEQQPELINPLAQ